MKLRRDQLSAPVAYSYSPMKFEDTMSTNFHETAILHNQAAVTVQS